MATFAFTAPDGTKLRRNSKTRTYTHAILWHRDEASAKAEAECMRQKKIASLKKQIARLEAKKF